MHTPAPFKVFEQHHILYILDANGQDIATVHGLEDGINNAERIKESQANAALFAAAPETARERDRLRDINSDLLNSLKFLVSAVETEPSMYIYTAHIKKAQAAIIDAEWYQAQSKAKAEGDKNG